MTNEAGPNIVYSGLSLSLDAANSRSYPGSGTTWTNLIGNGINGTLTSGPTFSSSNNGSIVFDGSNDHIDFGDVLDLGTNDLTINVWVRATALTPGAGNILVSKTRASVQNYRFVFGFFNGFMYSFFQGNSGAGTDIAPTGTTAIATNTWHMLTYVVTRSSSISMYLNGVPESLTGSATISQWNGLDFQSNNPFRIGSSTESDNVAVRSLFNGNIGNVQLYFRSLSAAEIRQNFNAIKGRYGL